MVPQEKPLVQPPPHLQPTHRRARRPRGRSAWLESGQAHLRETGDVTGPHPGYPPGKTAGGLQLVLISLLIPFRAPAGEGAVLGRWSPAASLSPHTLCLPLLSSSPAFHPPSLLLHLLLPHPAPSGVPSCSPCFLIPPWAGERKGRDHSDSFKSLSVPQCLQGLVPWSLPSLLRSLSFLSLSRAWRWGGPQGSVLTRQVPTHCSEAFSKARGQSPRSQSWEG